MEVFEADIIFKYFFHIFGLLCLYLSLPIAIRSIEKLKYNKYKARQISFKWVIRVYFLLSIINNFILKINKLPNFIFPIICFFINYYILLDKEKYKQELTDSKKMFNHTIVTVLSMCAVISVVFYLYYNF